MNWPIRKSLFSLSFGSCCPSWCLVLPPLVFSWTPLPLPLFAASLWLQPSVLSWFTDLGVVGVKGRVCGSGLEGGEEGPVDKAGRESLAAFSQMLPAWTRTLSGGYLHAALPGDAGLSQGGWFMQKLGNLSFISYKPAKYWLQIRPEDNHTSGHSSVKIYYVLGSVPF